MNRIPKNIVNFRDLGGIKTKDGKTIKKGLLLRSGKLSDIDEKDKEILRDDYRLRKIVDLRTPQEAVEYPDLSVEGADYEHLFIFDERLAGFTREKGSGIIDVIRNCKKGQEVYDEMQDLVVLYKDMVSGKDISGNLTKVLQTVMEAVIRNECVLYHCTIGKDRTGTVTICLLFLLEVAEEEIKADYMRTNEALESLARELYDETMKLHHDKKAAEKVYRTATAVMDYYDSAVNYMTEKSGSPVAYIKNELGISADLIERFRLAALE